MDDLLTTRQLQDMLQVDRITIYRMLHDGRLRGFKIGGQWRFSRREIDTWLQAQQSSLDAKETSDLQPRPPASSQVLPLSCVQAIQSVCAEALNIAAITIDLEGRPLTDLSNSCAFCDLILSTEKGRQRCSTAWRFLVNGEAHFCHAGLRCVSALVEVSGQPLAITVGCQFFVPQASATAPAWQAKLSMLSADLGLPEPDLRAAAGSVRVVPQDHLVRVSALLQRIAGTFSEIGQERLNLLSRLQHIAEVSKI